MQHGMTGDASEFMINAPHKAPAFVAAREGFDVWMGNNRGCHYSLEHVTLKYNDKTPDFWNFDFEDMGVKDLPAMFNYTLNHTGLSKLTYIGHSMGAT
jgi:pimeloyl-ACP methyl ester carboxylesterase